MPPAAAAQLAASAAAAAGQRRRGPGAGGQVAQASRRGLAPPGGLTEGRRARAASALPRAGGESSSLAQKAMQTGASTIFREGGVAAGVTVPFVCPERGRLSTSPARGSRGPAWAGDPRGRERPDPGQTSGSWCQAPRHLCSASLGAGTEAWARAGRAPAPTLLVSACSQAGCGPPGRVRSGPGAFRPQRVESSTTCRRSPASGQALEVPSDGGWPKHLRARLQLHLYPHSPTPVPASTLTHTPAPTPALLYPHLSVCLSCTASHSLTGWV